MPLLYFSVLLGSYLDQGTVRGAKLNALLIVRARVGYRTSQVGEPENQFVHPYRSLRQNSIRSSCYDRCYDRCSIVLDSIFLNDGAPCPKMVGT